MTKLKEFLLFIGLGFITVGLVFSGLLIISYSAFMTCFLFVLVSIFSIIGSLLTLVIAATYVLYKKLFRKK